MTFNESLLNPNAKVRFITLNQLESISFVKQNNSQELLWQMLLPPKRSEVTKCMMSGECYGCCTHSYF